MLKVRVIPTLLWKTFNLVKGKGFDSWRQVGSVMPSIKVYNTRDVDELIVLDISATDEQRDPDYETISEFCDECFVPLTYGGGVTSIESIRKLLLSGADKVAINSHAYSDLLFIREASNRYGSQCIVASIDAKINDYGVYECFSHAGKRPTGKDPVVWAKILEESGVGEILLTSIDRDGFMNGYDIELVHKISAAVSVPVIASGGAGNYAHFLEAIQSGGASAVAAASIFHFTEQTPLEAKQYLSQHGVPVRKT